MSDNTNIDLYNDSDIGDLGQTENIDNTDHGLASDSPTSEKDSIVDSGDSAVDNTSDSDSINHEENLENNEETSSENEEEIEYTGNSGMGESSSDYSSLLANIDGLLYEHFYNFDTFTKSVITVSGNAITISPDDTTAFMLQTMESNQKLLIEQQDTIKNFAILIFLVLAADFMWLCAKRIVKNMVKVGKANE